MFCKLISGRFGRALRCPRYGGSFPQTSLGSTEAFAVHAKIGTVQDRDSVVTAFPHRLAQTCRPFFGPHGPPLQQAPD